MVGMDFTGTPLENIVVLIYQALLQPLYRRQALATASQVLVKSQIVWSHGVLETSCPDLFSFDEVGGEFLGAAFAIVP
jgi:hypothetical protein